VRPFAGNNATITGQNATAVTGSFDEIRLGGTWESVTSLAVVPEPGSIGLAAMGALGLAGVYRNRRRVTD
jgi:MYXO-CTERM domain-containing protein